MASRCKKQMHCEPCKQDHRSSVCPEYTNDTRSVNFLAQSQAETTQPTESTIPGRNGYEHVQEAKLSTLSVNNNKGAVNDRK